MNYTLKTRAVNSKRLLASIRGFEQIFTEYQIVWSNEGMRQSVVDMIDGMLKDIADSGRISQWNVVCDYRNNKVSAMTAGIYNITITYRQINCLNTTKLKYRIYEEDDLELDFNLEF